MLRACVEGRDDDGVFKVDLTAVCIGDTAIVENLEQDIQDIRVRLFDSRRAG